MFDDLITKAVTGGWTEKRKKKKKKEKQNYFYKIFDYGSAFLDFKNKVIEFKGKFTTSDFVNFKSNVDNKYGKFIIIELCYTEKWKWISNGIRARGYLREILENEHRN